MGNRRIYSVRIMGGNKKYRVFCLELGNFVWGLEVIIRKTRIIDVVYNVSNNELVRIKIFVKFCIV